jgi:hypothetical protein
MQGVRISNDLPSLWDGVAVELDVLQCSSETAEDGRDDAKCLLRDSPCQFHLGQIFPGQSLSISLVLGDLLMLCAKKDKLK